MLQFFLRLYFGIVLTLGIAAAVIVSIMLRNIEADGVKLLEDIAQIPMAIVTEPVSATRPGEEGPVLKRLAEQIGAPVQLGSYEDMDVNAEAYQRVMKGEVVAAVNMRPPMYYRRLPDGRLLVMGPFHAIRPLMGQRGIESLLVVLVCLSVAVPLLLRPLRTQLTDLTRGATAFGRGELSVRLSVPPGQATTRLAEEFNGMASRIEQLIESQRYLLRAVAHDLRTPLCRLRYGVELLQDVDDREQRQALLEDIDRDFEELHLLIEELLVFSRLREGASPLNLVPGSYCQLVRDACDRLPPGYDGVRVQVSCPASVVEGLLDSEHLRRALVNLITNAQRHARTLVLVAVEAAGEQVQLSVDDDGPGIPEAQRLRVFEPFVRLNKTRERNGAGVGLGLAIVQQIVQWMDGRIWVETSPLGGARFVMTLPLQPPLRIEGPMRHELPATG